MILAFANQKGGVGKTTTAINLGAFLALRGQRVLLLDLDPQANATSSLGLDKRALQASIYDVLIDGLPLTEIMLATRLPGLHLIPSVPALAGAEVELAHLPNRSQVLGERLGTLRFAYDWILIDCPPSLGLLTINALGAADAVVIPVQCEYLALEGLSQLMETIDLVRQSLNPPLSIFGLVMTMFDARLHLATQVVQQVTAHFPDKVFHTIIPRNVRIAEAPSYGEPLATFDPHSRGGQAYLALTDEFMARGEGQMPDAGRRMAESKEAEGPSGGEASEVEGTRTMDPGKRAVAEAEREAAGDAPGVRLEALVAISPAPRDSGSRAWRVEVADSLPVAVAEDQEAPGKARGHTPGAEVIPTEIAGETEDEPPETEASR